MGGAQAIGRFLGELGPSGLDLRLAGLCDAGEERDFARALERAGLGSSLTRTDMERLGFYVCVDDLEDDATYPVDTDPTPQTPEQIEAAKAWRDKEVMRRFKEQRR